MSIDQEFPTVPAPPMVLPLSSMAENVSQFTDFMAKNGVRYITTAPYHPASNGQAERYFQTFKQAYRAGHGSLSQKMPNFLLQYRHSPNGTTRCSQAQLMFGRPLRTRLDLISPNDAFQRKRNDQALHLSIAIQIVS
ncbi:uncharacterized protein K02A2.6 [Exaiptasia diaphana]|uniref:Integrase catalytic domain-containing protein n=1 Tax=Exaiptasia diaphana TaxID=2652724 RepID=A0A913XXC2_EXADI|nr:uncharacterized protein K02A2.6 [Exaiptasia diaphana]